VTQSSALATKSPGQARAVHSAVHVVARVNRLLGVTENERTVLDGLSTRGAKANLPCLWVNRALQVMHAVKRRVCFGATRAESPKASPIDV
jgi:hypothetical protein